MWFPEMMKIAPALDESLLTGPPRDKTALLINPFYRKDPRASFGKHVLTPTLALTSIAAATPDDWQVRIWDENLLQGPPPHEPFPALVGISVHLTFAGRAYELADWYRRRGAQVVMGGLHVMSCPDEVARHADAIAVGDGVGLWSRILKDAGAGCLKKRYCRDFSRPYRLDPLPRRELLPTESFLTTLSLIATRGCHNRCGFCYMSTRGVKMPYQVREPKQVAAEFEASDEPYGVFVDNNLGSDREYLRALCRELTGLTRYGVRRSASMLPTMRPWCETWPLPVVPGCLSAWSRWWERTWWMPAKKRRCRRTMPGGWRYFTPAVSRSTPVLSLGSITTRPMYSIRRLDGSRKTVWPAPPFTSSPLIRERRCFANSKSSAASCTGTGIATTLPMWCFNRAG